MPFHARPIECGRVLLVRATGPAERADWDRLLRARVGEEWTGLIVDLRRRETLPPGAVALLIGRDLAQLAPRLSAIALVARPGAQFGLTRMAGTMAGDSGGAARSFHDLREALEWVRSMHSPTA